MNAPVAPSGSTDDAAMTQTASETKVAEHTPGPWRSTGFEYEPEAGWFVREARDSRYLAIASVRCTYRETEEIEANARLIAAAPELLEALERALIFIGNTEDEFGDNLECGDIARAAIAKARGAAQ